MCEKALCVVSNELVLVSVWQGVYLQAFGELMKDFPCCPTAKKKQESRKADTRRARRGPASSGVLREEHALHNQRKRFTFPWLESPGPPCPGEHPSAQTSLGSLHTPAEDHPHRSPEDRETQHLWVSWCHACFLWDSSLQKKKDFWALPHCKGSPKRVPWTCTIISVPWNPSFCLKAHIWLGSSKGSAFYLNSALKSSWQMPGMHWSKRKQMLVCSSHGGWVFTMAGRMETSLCARHLHKGRSCSGSSTSLSVHDTCATATADSYSSDIPR